jgi:hypothetical protein
MADLQAQHALAHEYRVYSHGNQFDQRQGMSTDSDAIIDALLAGATLISPRLPGVPGSGKLSPGYGMLTSNLCPCHIARAHNGAANCGVDH